jgi:hypothetical protein
MPYFISYSHEDKDFVDLLAAELVLERRHVWVDRWELKVGDSLIRRIESAVKDASGLIAILSKASVVSEWFRKELSAGCVRGPGRSGKFLANSALKARIVIVRCASPVTASQNLIVPCQTYRVGVDGYAGGRQPIALAGIF